MLIDSNCYFVKNDITFFGRKFDIEADLEPAPLPLSLHRSIAEKLSVRYKSGFIKRHTTKDSKGRFYIFFQNKYNCRNVILAPTKTYLPYFLSQCR